MEALGIKTFAFGLYSMDTGKPRAFLLEFDIFLAIVLGPLGQRLVCWRSGSAIP